MYLVVGLRGNEYITLNEFSSKKKALKKLSYYQKTIEYAKVGFRKFYIGKKLKK